MSGMQASAVSPNSRRRRELPEALRRLRERGVTVRAVLTAAGKCDRKKTAERVAEVARGVAAKIDLGVIVAPPVEEEGATE